MKQIKFIIALIILALLMSACDGSTGITSTDLRLADTKIDSRFREFYDYLGGSSILGPAISQKMIQGGKEYQYTSKSLMVYSPDAAEDQRYQLAALGIELGISEAPMSPDAPNGHEIYAGFIDLYTRLGGARFVGLPITEVHINHEANRIEQHFENIGFYQLDGTPATDVRLLAYGSWKCAEYCGHTAIEDAVILRSPDVAPGFSDAVNRLSPSFIGYPLTEQYSASDGMLEQIFENVVIVADPGNPGGIKFRPILGMLGVSAKGSGYAVPAVFDDFINQNSGFGFSGQAISEYSSISTDVYRQCYTNYCLDYYPNAPEELQVRLTALGYSYKNLYYKGDSGDSSGAQNNVTMRVWERHSLLSSDQIQDIGVSLSAGDESLKNFEPVLTLNIPDIGEVTYKFPPTNADGNSHIELNPINAPNSTRIGYQVCVTNMNDRFCIEDDFMIWGNP